MFVLCSKSTLRLKISQFNFLLLVTPSQRTVQLCARNFNRITCIVEVREEIYFIRYIIYNIQVKRRLTYSESNTPEGGLSFEFMASFGLRVQPYIHMYIIRRTSLLIGGSCYRWMIVTTRLFNQKSSTKSNQLLRVILILSSNAFIPNFLT